MSNSILKATGLILPFTFYWAYWQTENLQCWKKWLLLSKPMTSKLKITAVFIQLCEVSNFKIQWCVTHNICIIFHKDICLSGITDFLFFHIFTQQGADSSLGVNAMQTLNCKWIISYKLPRVVWENSLFYWELYAWECYKKIQTKNNRFGREGVKQ